MLVVDDEKDARDVIGHALEERGATHHIAENSHDALEILERGDIDVLLADIAMPEEDGYSLIQRIRSFGQAQSGDHQGRRCDGARKRRRAPPSTGSRVPRHVSKPVEPFELARIVHHLIHDRRASRRSRM